MCCVLKFGRVNLPSSSNLSHSEREREKREREEREEREKRERRERLTETRALRITDGVGCLFRSDCFGNRRVQNIHVIHIQKICNVNSGIVLHFSTSQ